MTSRQDLHPGAAFVIRSRRSLDERNAFDAFLDGGQGGDEVLVRSPELARHDRLGEQLVEIGEGHEIAFRGG